MTTTYYMGDWYEWVVPPAGAASAVSVTYYCCSGRRAAMRTVEDGVYWIHADHLGSAMMTTIEPDGGVTVTSGMHY